MNELQTVIELYGYAKAAGVQAALATVVRVQGSVYRQAGAKMLILADGRTVGLVSGGCLERDISARGLQVIASGKSQLVRYDNRYLLGCHGVVEVKIESLDASPNLIPFLADCFSERQPGCIATIVASKGLPDRAANWHGMMSDASARLAAPFERMSSSDLAADMIACLRGSSAIIKRYEWPSGYVDLFLEPIRPPVPLVIFGGGYDVPPVVRLAKGLGWHVTVVRNHRAQAGPDEFEADVVAVDRLVDRLTGRQGSASPVPLTEETVAVVMTHNFAVDVRLLHMLLASPVRYIGLLGPHMRTSELLDELARAEESWGKAIDLSQANLARVYSPIGLDIGAEGPEEIALAIVAEIKTLLAGRPANSLRDRNGPIHAHSASPNHAYRPEGISICPSNMMTDQLSP